MKKILFALVIMINSHMHPMSSTPNHNYNSPLTILLQKTAFTAYIGLLIGGASSQVLPNKKKFRAILSGLAKIAGALILLGSFIAEPDLLPPCAALVIGVSVGNLLGNTYLNKE